MILVWLCSGHDGSGKRSSLFVLHDTRDTSEATKRLNQRDASQRGADSEKAKRPTFCMVLDLLQPITCVCDSYA